MRARHLAGCSAVLTVFLASVVACVGDDPSTTVSDPAADGGGTESRTDGSSVTPSEKDGGADVNDTKDAAVGSDADATTPFDVRALPGLRLWLESTKGLNKAAVGDDLVSWQDSSERWDGGAGAPDGGRHVAMPVAYNGGGAVYPGVVTNGINGRPAVTFTSGPKLAVANHPDFDFGTGDLVIAAVGSVSTGTGPFWRLMTATTAPTGTFLGAANACTFLGGLGADPDCTSPDYSPNTSAHAFVMRRKAAQLVFRVDGTSRGTYDFGVENPNLGVATFQQASAFIGGAFSGQLAEVIVIVGSTSDGDLDSLETHLRTKYALP